MAQSSDDIKRKLQKAEGQNHFDLGKQLDVAWRVYQNREKHRETAKQKIVAVMEGISKGIVLPGKERG